MTQEGFFIMGDFFKFLALLLILLFVGSLAHTFCSHNFPDEVKKNEIIGERLLMHAISWTPDARSKLIEGYMQDGRFEEAAYWVNYAVQQGDMDEDDAETVMSEILLMEINARIKRLAEGD